jgi:formylglycine-generating enzyme required for sulfatase activity
MFGKIPPLEETLPEDQIKLKPILGIRPGIYLAGLYGLIILIVLFFLLLYPGLVRPGIVLSLSSEPWGAAVRVDGVYLGTAPGDFFISRGRHQIEMGLPGFDPRKIEKDFGGRLFASRFFPLRERIHEKLGLTGPAEAFFRAAADYAAWSLTGEPTAAYQIPLSLSEGAYQAGPAGTDPAVYREFGGILSGSLGFAVTRFGLRDIIRAKYLIDNGGLSPSPVTLLRSAGDMLNFLSGNPEAALWLGDLLPPETAALITGSSWYKAGQEPAPVPSPGYENSGGDRVFSLESLYFREIPGGVLIQNTPAPRQIVLEDFSIAETEISPEAWEAFVRACPEWGKENTSALKEQGFVNGDYLEGPDNPGSLNGYPAAAVPGVSWYAAQAYCQWLTGLLPPSLSSREVRLPSEAEWEYAAKRAGRAGRDDVLETGLRDMIGGLWEWCGEPFVPLLFFRPAQEGEFPIDSPEKPVRGGSWVNSPGSVSAETRGSLPPSSCSPFVSFRPVIALRKTL